jgi:hypothetical protein
MMTIEDDGPQACVPPSSRIAVHHSSLVFAFFWVPSACLPARGGAGSPSSRLLQPKNDDDDAKDPFSPLLDDAFWASIPIPLLRLRRRRVPSCPLARGHEVVRSVFVERCFFEFHTTHHPKNRERKMMLLYDVVPKHERSGLRRCLHTARRCSVMQRTSSASTGLNLSKQKMPARRINRYHQSHHLIMSPADAGHCVHQRNHHDQPEKRNGDGKNSVIDIGVCPCKSDKKKNAVK